MMQVDGRLFTRQFTEELSSLGEPQRLIVCWRHRDDADLFHRYGRLL